MRSGRRDWRRVFLATPADASMQLTPALLEAGAKVIDLSGAFRLGTAQNFERWYKEPHTQPGLLSEAAYGLPEFCRARIAGARLIANPGCYPTAANLALRPLIEAGVIAREAGIVCDAKSGVSGAGRKPSLKTSFCEVTENFSTYAILEHRHVPEILRTSGIEEGELSFTAQLSRQSTAEFSKPFTSGTKAIQIRGTICWKFISGESTVRSRSCGLYAPGNVPGHSIGSTD